MYKHIKSIDIRGLHILFCHPTYCKSSGGQLVESCAQLLTDTQQDVLLGLSLIGSMSAVVVSLKLDYKTTQVT